MRSGASSLRHQFWRVHYTEIENKNLNNIFEQNHNCIESDAAGATRVYSKNDLKKFLSPQAVVGSLNRSAHSAGPGWELRTEAQNLWATAASADLFHSSLVARRSSLAISKSRYAYLTYITYFTYFTFPYLTLPYLPDRKTNTVPSMFALD